MKTLLEAAIEFERSQGGASYVEWNEKHGAPYLMTIARHAFFAGAAAMAELFASGQALKVEQMPRKYLISHESRYPDGSRLGVSYQIVTAFSREEALKQLGYQGDASTWGLEVRPATEADEKIEGVMHV